MQIRQLVAVMVLLGLVSSVAYAGVFAELPFVPSFAMKSNGGSPAGSVPDIVEQGFGYDVRPTVGYTTGPLLIGFSAALYSFEVLQKSTNPSDSNTSIFAAGPSIGAVFGGFHAIATYYFIGSQKVTNKTTLPSGVAIFDQDVESKSPQGAALDIGYAFSVGPSVRIGPSLIYRSVAFKKYSITDRVTPANNKTDQDYKTKPVSNGLTPMINVTFTFGGGSGF